MEKSLLTDSNYRVFGKNIDEKMVVGLMLDEHFSVTYDFLFINNRRAGKCLETISWFTGLNRNIQKDLLELQSLQVTANSESELNLW